MFLFNGELSGIVLVVGVGVVLVSYGLKVGICVLLNILFELVSNWIVLVVEDIVVVGGFVLVLVYLWLVLIVVIVCSLIGVLIVWWVWCVLWCGMCWLFGQFVDKMGSSVYFGVLFLGLGG